MIIVSQDKKVITNFNNTLGMQIEAHLSNGDGEKDYEVKVITEKRICTIGIYDTEERAKEVLQEIIKSYRNYRTAECDGYTNVLQETAVFEMPED
ncbi:MAG TPA: hypothetical protein OIM60_03460 [Clostridiaceae bacterium]|jgi:hypothetical protein|nr:hypothetical protein [Clostridiaceae bacterium]